MCGADRPSQNGAVAIIHRAVSSQNIRLLFRNPTHPSTANTVVSYETGLGYERGARQDSQQPMRDFTLQIHQHGDLTAPNKDAAVAPICLKTIEGQTAHEVELDTRLDLFVGGKGVVGRMVSVLNGKEKLGDGVIGWN
ncbi:hypothetical protein JMJ35_003879 [Cladonia borealis]|uniref:Uncharacterized protein n=1 Tax=Cladonia borealis TaxID=184061 RepID=A0AA39R3E1_9LECA|nr:hypothetical protein JMJ35_003879 [Cladonia borealis]